ncbi:MAG TPA: hypothetical protein VJC06_01715 [Candidatus Paceibacterota bacterium]
MKRSLIFLVSIFVVNLVGLYYQWYLVYPWFDQTLHFLGGSFIAMLMANYLSEYFVNKNTLKNLLIIVGVTVFIGVAWEFAEYIANQTLIEPVYIYFKVHAYFMGDLDDTVSDLLMDILGATTLSLLHLRRRRKSHEVQTNL